MPFEGNLENLAFLLKNILEIVIRKKTAEYLTISLCVHSVIV